MDSSPTKSVAEDRSTFAADFERSMLGLRGATIEALASAFSAAQVAPEVNPRDIQKHIGLNRNLAWKLTKMVHSTDVYEALQHVPGREGLEILAGALTKAGADKAVVSGLRSALTDFDHMIEVHVGDRKNLDVYVSSTMPGGICGDHMEANRALGYRANSATFGVQARVDFSLSIIALNAQRPDFCDIGSVKGMLGFRRMRETTSWPVLRGGFLQRNIELGEKAVEAIDDRDGGHEHLLMRDFCSTPLPNTRLVQSDAQPLYEIGAGPVGKRAEIDCVFGLIRRGVLPVFGEEGDETVGEHHFRAETPAERMHFDLLLHTDLPFPMPPGIVTCSKLHSEPSFPYSRDTRSHLPGVANLQELAGGRGSIATPHIARYGEMVELACERMGHRVEDFRTYRISLTYPPIPLTFVAHHALGKHPG